MVFWSSRIAAYCLGGLTLGAGLVIGMPGCSSADAPADATDAATSASQLSGRYEPGSPDTAWLWFDGTSAVKGVSRNGTTVEGTYAIEKVGAGHELVLNLKDGKVSRYAFKPGKTFKAEQKAALGASNLRIRDYCVDGKTCMCDTRNTCNLPYSTPSGNLCKTSGGKDGLECCMNVSCKASTGSGEGDRTASAKGACPTATNPNPEPGEEALPASRPAGNLKLATGPLLSGCSQLLTSLEEVLSAMTTGDDGVSSPRTAGTPRAATVAANTGDLCQLVGQAPCAGCASGMTSKQSGTACYCCFN